MSNFTFRVPEISRRDLLKLAAVAGAAATLPSGLLRGQFVDKSTAKGGRIDVHHHHVPPMLAAPGNPQTSGGRFPWTPEKTLEQMDKFDIAVAMLSMTQMGNILYDNTEKGRTAVRTGNDYGAKVHGRIIPSASACSPACRCPISTASMKEIEYGLDTLKADGIGIYTNDNQGNWPGDAYFDPMWQELNRRKAIVYMHPLAPPCCTNLNDSVSTAHERVRLRHHARLHQHPGQWRAAQVSRTSRSSFRIRAAPCR